MSLPTVTPKTGITQLAEWINEEIARIEGLIDDAKDKVNSLKKTADALSDVELGETIYIKENADGIKGYVGINENNPQEHLHVKENLQVDNDAYVLGNMGIGTASPDFDLDIDNGTSTSSNLVVRGASGSVILQDQDATSGAQAAQSLVANGTWKLRGLNDNLTAQTVKGITVDLADGNFGIGTASPNSPLEIDLPTSDLEIVDAEGTTPTEQGTVTVKTSNGTGYLRIYATP